MRLGRALAHRVLLFLFSIAIFLGTGEAALRFIYRDRGVRTLGGPGGRAFEHLTIHDDVRWRVDTGPKKPGVPRIMILGDSITWGQGVRNWQDVWPEQLALMLDHAERPHEMAVFAMPGRDIGTHLAVMDESADEVQPDVFIYQWYVNDVEVLQHRPRNVRWWHRSAWHASLQRSSDLYYFMDNRLSTFLPQPERSYVDYIRQDFAPGSLEWAEFERYFHALAARAKEIARTRLLIIYPQVPFRGTSPLQPVYDRLRAMAGAHRLDIPPEAWIRFAGASVHAGDAPWHQAVQVPASTTGPVIETREYYMTPGPAEIDAAVQMQDVSQNGASLDTARSKPLGTIDIVDHATNQTIASVPLPAGASKGGWQEIAVHVDIPGERGRAIRFRVAAAGSASFALASLDVPVDYGMTVVDLTGPLNTFNTHTSVFDAHPNEPAHKVIATKVFEALEKTAARH